MKDIVWYNHQEDFYIFYFYVDLVINQPLNSLIIFGFFAGENLLVTKFDDRRFDQNFPEMVL